MRAAEISHRQTQEILQKARRAQGCSAASVELHGSLSLYGFWLVFDTTHSVPLLDEFGQQSSFCQVTLHLGSQRFQRTEEILRPRTSPLSSSSQRGWLRLLGFT
jgi:hypothetical protein